MDTVFCKAFTSKYEGISNRLVNDVAIRSESTETKTTAQWDTGASITCIADEFANKLNLPIVGKMTIKTPSGEKIVNTYLVDVILPNNVKIEKMMVCGTEIGNQGIGVLIGMDIIATGDFAVSSYGGHTVFTFRVPSKKTTDYVQEINIKRLTGQHGPGKRKRNKK